MAQRFANAARAELAATINNSDTTLTISSGGSLFPVANTGASSISNAADWFKLVLQDITGYEIVYVRTHTADSTTFSNVLRAQEGTTAKGFDAGSIVGLRPTAGDAEANATKTGVETLSNKTLTAPTIEGYTEGVSTSSGAALTVDLASDTVFGITTTGNLTITLPAPVVGKSCEVHVTYGGAHTVAHSITGGSTLLWDGGTAATPTSTNGKTDVFAYRVKATGTPQWIAAKILGNI